MLTDGAEIMRPINVNAMSGGDGQGDGREGAFHVFNCVLCVLNGS